MLLLFHTHFVSHLFEVLFHDLVACCFSLIIHFFAESDNISWINEFFKLLVADVTDSFELVMAILWIRIGDVETLVAT